MRSSSLGTVRAGDWIGIMFEPVSMKRRECFDVTLFSLLPSQIMRTKLQAQLAAGNSQHVSLLGAQVLTIQSNLEVTTHLQRQVKTQFSKHKQPSLLQTQTSKHQLLVSVHFGFKYTYNTSPRLFELDLAKGTLLVRISRVQTAEYY